MSKLKFTNEQLTILSSVIAGEMENVSDRISNDNQHWQEYYTKLGTIEDVLERNDVLWGYLELEDGTVIDLDGVNASTITLSSPIKDYGREELGEEANVLVQRSYARDKQLDTIKKVRKYFKKFMK